MTLELDLPLDGRAARETRAAALATAEGRFPEVARRFHDIYGMRLPRHVLYAAAFFLGLSAEERALCPCSLFGFSEWFRWLAPDEPERIATLDARLECRFRADPPEFVTMISGDGDGSHWGLVYDDPNELPTLVGHGYARDDGVIRAEQKTLLASIRAKVAERDGLDADDKRRVRAMVGYLDALRVHEERARVEEGIALPPAGRIELAHGGIGAYVPDFSMPPELPTGYARWKHYVDDAHAEDVRRWIARAETELEAGKPGLALVIGLELHHADRDATREDCTRLLTGAYRALGREALAEITRVHHAHRDLPTVGVYARADAMPAEPAPEWVPPPVLVAVRNLDLEALDASLRAEPPIGDLVLAASALADRFQYQDERQKKVGLNMLERLLEIGGAELASGILANHLIHARRCLDAEHLAKLSTRRDATQTREIVALFLAPKDRTAIDRVVAHGGRAESASTAEFAISTGELDLATAAIEAVPASTLAEHRGTYAAQNGWVGGVTLLHFAVCSTSLPIVELVLSRGFDPLAKDEAGNTPRDLAKMLWFLKANEANRMIELFDALLPEVEPAPVQPSFSEGAQVNHKKFGPGVIEKVDGQGDEAKVTVRFATETKTLQRKFLSLA